MNKFFKQLFLSIFLGILFFSAKTVFAENSNMNFQIGPVMSAKQLDKKHTYFDLKLKPGEKTNIQIKVQNNTDKKIVINTYATSTTTSDTGTVVYGKSKAKTDDSLAYQMADVAKTDDSELILKPHELKTVTYKVTMPTKPFSGILAGGINFVEKSVKSKADIGAVGVINQYGFSEALVLHGQNDNVLGSLKLGKVSFGQINAQSTFKTELINPHANFLNRLTVEQKIYKENMKKPIYDSKQIMLQMAPNSKFTYLSLLKGEKVTAGNYRVVTKATSKGRIWNFSKKIKVTSTQANSSNDSDPTIAKSSFKFYAILFVILIISGLVISWWIHKKRLKKQEEIEALKLRVKQLESKKK